MTLKDIDILISHAQGALEKAHAPYSKFKVGVSLMTRSGNIYTGSNIENASLALTVCAERIALMKAITGQGADALGNASMAVVSSDGRYCFPCGACRQMLYEFAPDMVIYLKSKTGIKKFTIKELLPHPFIKGD